jgi:hypothetical protein
MSMSLRKRLRYQYYCNIINSNNQRLKMRNRYMTDQRQLLRFFNGRDNLKSGIESGEN